jgi:hypothetical protein
MDVKRKLKKRMVIPCNERLVPVKGFCETESHSLHVMQLVRMLHAF